MSLKEDINYIMVTIARTKMTLPIFFIHYFCKMINDIRITFYVFNDRNSSKLKLLKKM